MRAANVRPPAPDVFEAQVLERLIIDRALLQFAKDNGVRVDDQMVERTIQRIAQENKITTDDLKKALDREKVSYAKYREDIRREVTIQRLREREVDSKVQVSEAEVDNYLAIDRGAGRRRERVPALAHHDRVPEQATPDQIDARKRRAEEALAKIKGGKDFKEAAAEFSDAQDATQGGDLGWRTPARLPSVFVDGGTHDAEGRRVAGAAQRGGVSHRQAQRLAQPQRADGRRADARAAHPRARQRERRRSPRRRPRSSASRTASTPAPSFVDQAKLNSEDASSSKGGDLGWVNPGDTVPEFEQAMNKLKLNEISGPVRSPFGWHLILVEERRTQDITQERKRDVARSAIRARKADEQFSEFMRQVRDKAYVEYKTDDK